MTVRVRTEWKGDEFAAMVRDVVTTRGLPAAAHVVEGRMKDNLSGPGPSSPGSPPGQMNGLLKNSIGISVSGMTARIGTNLKYGRYLEYGATIRPRFAKWLPVPVTRRAKALLRQGVAGDLMGTGQTSLRRSGANLQVIRSKRGEPILMEMTKKGKPKTNGAVFILRKVVRLLPRPWAFRSLNEARSDANRAFAAAVSRELKKRAKAVSTP